MRDIKKLLLKTTILACIVSILGFGVMNLFSIFMIYSDKVPGLYDYNAATWGDGLFLPLFISVMYYYVKSKNLLRLKHKIISFIIGGIFATIGFGWQLSWLLDENIKLNWTIPVAGSFNAAGWYHFFMFITFFFIISMLMSQVWFTRKLSSDNGEKFNSVLAKLLMWLFGSGFLFLLH